MIYVDNIRNFKPSCEQEKKDKIIIENLIEQYQDKILYRENELFHFTSAAFVLNETFDKLLMVHHNIYQSWSWAGGHADGEKNLMHVAIKEIREETAVSYVKPLLMEPISLDILTTQAHKKNGNYVPSHLHFNVSYLFKADEKEKISIKPDENSRVDWLSIYEIEQYVTDPEMLIVCNKVIERIKSIQKN